LGLWAKPTLCYCPQQTDNKNKILRSQKPEDRSQNKIDNSKPETYLILEFSILTPDSWLLTPLWLWP
ncbi:MAG: hypothetical protein FWG40_12950, partial [Peptococcaceae bacterium]|nr:hypothetical protein [Peptococcaceae bacterium]